MIQIETYSTPTYELTKSLSQRPRKQSGVRLWSCYNVILSQVALTVGVFYIISKGGRHGQ